jgi:hypothetical protein
MNDMPATGAQVKVYGRCVYDYHVTYIDEAYNICQGISIGTIF